MKKKPKTICPLLCPMINAQGFCESAWRRVGQVHECPHSKLRRAVSKSDTGKRRQRRTI